MRFTRRPWQSEMPVFFRKTKGKMIFLLNPFRFYITMVGEKPVSKGSGLLFLPIRAQMNRNGNREGTGIVMRFVSIASGSSGNCIYIGSDNTHILIDAGISNKRIEKGLSEIGVKGSELDGVFITHEHADHIQGLGILARKYPIPIYGTKETLEEIAGKASLGEYPKELLRPILPDVDFHFGDLQIRPFRIDHDAANPVAYRVQHGKKSVAVATDLGHYDQYVIDHLQGLDALLLEANHDVRMLETGPYPYRLKQRILGDYGHLSNENCGRLLNCILHDHLKKILLGHLSEKNNFAELAYETVCLEITQGETAYQAKDFSIAVAGRDSLSEIVTV